MWIVHFNLCTKLLDKLFNLKNLRKYNYIYLKIFALRKENQKVITTLESSKMWPGEYLVMAASKNCSTYLDFSDVYALRPQVVPDSGVEIPAWSGRSLDPVQDKSCSINHSSFRKKLHYRILSKPYTQNELQQLLWLWSCIFLLIMLATYSWNMNVEYHAY